MANETIAVKLLSEEVCSSAISKSSAVLDASARRSAACCRPLMGRQAETLLHTPTWLALDIPRIAIQLFMGVPGTFQHYELRLLVNSHGYVGILDFSV